MERTSVRDLSEDIKVGNDALNQNNGGGFGGSPEAMPADGKANVEEQPDALSPHPDLEILRRARLLVAYFNAVGKN